jgi:hypothetical protein
LRSRLRSGLGTTADNPEDYDDGEADRGQPRQHRIIVPYGVNAASEGRKSESERQQPHCTSSAHDAGVLTLRTE